MHSNSRKSWEKTFAKRAIEKIVDSFTEYEPGESWLHTGGIKITIGAPSLKLKDRAAALIALPKLVEDVRGFGDPLHPGSHALDARSLASEGW